jgi:hypothetical protein
MPLNCIATVIVCAYIYGTYIFKNQQRLEHNHNLETKTKSLLSLGGDETDLFCSSSAILC